MNKNGPNTDDCQIVFCCLPSCLPLEIVKLPLKILVAPTVTHPRYLSVLRLPQQLDIICRGGDSRHENSWNSITCHLYSSTTLPQAPLWIVHTPRLPFPSRVRIHLPVTLPGHRADQLIQIYRGFHFTSARVHRVLYQVRRVYYHQYHYASTFSNVTRGRMRPR